MSRPAPPNPGVTRKVFRLDGEEERTFLASERVGPWALTGLGALLVSFGPWPAALLGLPVYIVAVARTPSISVPSLMLTLPFYLQPRNLGGLELSLTELAIVSSVLALALRASGQRISGHHVDLHIPGFGSVDWIAAALLASGLLSLLVTEYPKQSLRELRWLLLEPVAAFYLARATVRTSGHVFDSLAALSAAGALAGVLALAALLFQAGLFQPTARAMAPYLSANHLALFLERSAAAALALALFGHRLRGLAWGTSGLALLALVRAVSLGAWLGFGTAGLVLLGMKSRRLALSGVVAATIAIGAALLILPPERGLDRMNPATGTAESRLEIWTSALHMVADHPILGVGLDNFLYLYRSEYILPQAWEEPNISHPHNWVLQFWLELGLPGLFAAIAMVTWVARAAHRRFYKPATSSDRPLAAAALGMVIVFLVHGAVDNSYFLVDLATVWWVVAGLLAVPVDDGSRRRQFA